MEINYCLFTLLRYNGTKAVQYCCIAKETQQCCSSALLRNSAPASRCYGNHNTQKYQQGKTDSSTRALSQYNISHLVAKQEKVLKEIINFALRSIFHTSKCSLNVITRPEADGFTFLPKEGVLRIFSPTVGIDPANLGFNGKHGKS
jgi:hypothetical protein